VEERAYILAIPPILAEGSIAIKDFAQLMQEPDPTSEAWMSSLRDKAGALEAVQDKILLLTPPPSLSSAHSHLVSAHEAFVEAAVSTVEAFETGTLASPAGLAKGTSEMTAYSSAMDAFHAAREGDCVVPTPLPEA
jgi:hypothetical protein